MFEFGSLTGALKRVGEELDAKKVEESVKKALDTKTVTSKLHEYTIGQFNDKKTTTVPVDEEGVPDVAAAEAAAANGEASSDDVKDAKSAKAVADMTDSEKQDLIERIAEKRARDAYKEAVDSGMAPADAVQLANNVEKVSKEMHPTDADLQAIADSEGVPTESSWLDSIKDTMNSPMVQGAIDQFCNSFCSGAPFPQCRSCPNRPDTAGSTGFAIPDILGIIDGAIKGLKDGLTGALNDMIGCPGLAQGIVNGDFEGIKRAALNQGLSALGDTALKMGAPAVLGAVEGLLPESMTGPDSMLAGLKNSAGKSGLADIKKAMVTVSATADGLMKAGTAISRGGPAELGKIWNSYGEKYPGPFGNLTPTSRQGLSRFQTNGTHAIDSRGNRVLVFNTTENQALLSTSANAISSAFMLKDTLKVNNMRTRGRFTSSQLSMLPGNSTPRSAYKRGFSLDYLRTGRSLPKDTKVSKFSSVTDALFGDSGYRTYSGRPSGYRYIA